MRCAARRAALLLALVGQVAGAGCAPPPPAAVAPAVAAGYVPAPDGWERRSPAALGMDSARLAEAVSFAVQHETPWPRDLRQALLQSSLTEGPFNEIVGPVRDRGPPAGMVVRRGYIAAEWGDTRRVDLTFSVSKSYLATIAGLAVDAGRIRGMDDPVRAYVPDTLFAGRNAPITWRQLLSQTSEWEGTLWEKPDVADRRAGKDRQIQPPGTFWEYNDVRVNLAALALLYVWDRPLPEVLEERVMGPIGASDSWRWYGYRNSYVTLGGRRVQSVSGGAHWGGGMWASTRDHARFGLLHERLGDWGGRRILSERWVRMATTPTPLKPTYGYFWWLNTDRKLFPSAPATSFFALGAGSNVIWVDPALDLVAVVRWIDNAQIDGFIARVVASLDAGPGTSGAHPERVDAPLAGTLAQPVHRGRHPDVAVAHHGGGHFREPDGAVLPFSHMFEHPAAAPSPAEHEQVLVTKRVGAKLSGASHQQDCHD